MKRIRNILATVSAAPFLALLLAQSAGAVPLTIGDSHELGFVDPGIPAGDQYRVNYVNHVIGMDLGTDEVGDGQHYFRSNNDFGDLSEAVLEQADRASIASTPTLRTPDRRLATSPEAAHIAVQIAAAAKTTPTGYMELRKQLHSAAPTSTARPWFGMTSRSQAGSATT